MTHVDHAALERVTGLELNLHQRFAARDLNRALRSIARQRRHGPVASSGLANYESDTLQACIGGLEVKYSSGSTVTVTKGSVIVPNPSQVTETRPGTYSPSPAEPDDDLATLAVLVADTNATPATPIASALTSPEFWIVTGDVALTTVESDSARSVFNETTGEFDSTSAAKIKRWTFVPKVIRGNPGDDLNTVLGTLTPAELKAMVSWVEVPVGATNLSTSIFYDVRMRLLESPGPNMCGGHGQVGYTSGTSAVPVPNVAPSPSSGIFAGHFWARHNGELLRFSTGRKLSAKLVKDPNATWDNTASPSAPKLAWLYLSRVAGRVPRPVAQGSTPFGNVPSAADIEVFLDGALVLSSVPPIGAIPATTANPTAGGRFDLRPSATLHLPGFAFAGARYEFAGMTSTDAICLGPVIYTGYDLTDDVPLISGPGTVDSAGWYSWPVGNDAGVAYTQDKSAFFSATTADLNTFNSTTDRFDFTMTVKTLTNGSYIPITAVRMMCWMAGLSGQFGQMAELLPNTGRFHTMPPYLGSGSNQFQSWVVTDCELAPQLPVARAKFLVGHTGTVTYDTAAVYSLAIRWPFNEPLAT